MHSSKLMVFVVIALLSAGFYVGYKNIPNNFAATQIRNVLKNARIVNVYLPERHGRVTKEEWLAVLSQTSHPQQFRDLTETEDFSPYKPALITTLNLDLRVSNLSGKVEDVGYGDGFLYFSQFRGVGITSGDFYRWTCSFPQVWNNVPIHQGGTPGLLLNALRETVSADIYTYSGYLRNPNNPITAMNVNQHSAQLRVLQSTTKIRFDSEYKPVQPSTLIIKLREKDGSSNLVAANGNCLIAPELSTDCAYPSLPLTRWLASINP